MALNIEASGPQQTGEPVLCQGCGARRDGVCHALTLNELSKLARTTTKRVVPNGESVGYGILGAEGLANVLSGVVRLTKHLPDGRRQIVGLQFAPTLLGRLFGSAEGLEAVAAGSVRLCTFSRSAFESALAGSPDLQNRVLSQTMVQLDEARDWLVSVGRKTALERVATYLELVAKHARQVKTGASDTFDAPSMQLPLTRGEMADLLGLTLETVSRKMTELRRTGIVEFTDASRVKILSRHRLHLVTGD